MTTTRPTLALAALLAATALAAPAQSMGVPQLVCTPILFSSGHDAPSIDPAAILVRADTRASHVLAQVDKLGIHLRLPDLQPAATHEGRTPPVATGSACGIGGTITGTCTALGCSIRADEACLEEGGRWTVSVDENVKGVVTGTMFCGTDTSDADEDGIPDNKVSWCTTTEVDGTDASHCESFGHSGDGEGRCEADADAMEGDVSVACEDPVVPGRVMRIVMHFS